MSPLTPLSNALAILGVAAVEERFDDRRGALYPRRSFLFSCLLQKLDNFSVLTLLGEF